MGHDHVCDEDCRHGAMLASMIDGIIEAYSREAGRVSLKAILDSLHVVAARLMSGIEEPEMREAVLDMYTKTMAEAVEKMHEAGHGPEFHDLGSIQ